MVRLRVAEQLEKRGWTAYRLAKEAGFSVALAYKLVRPEGKFGRLDRKTLDRLCTVFHCQPGQLLEWRPDRKARTTRR
jgi:DNA-binding Xre family transcriptional regulator